jgi:hypothetical protein
MAAAALYGAGENQFLNVSIILPGDPSSPSRSGKIAIAWDGFLWFSGLYSGFLTAYYFLGTLFSVSQPCGKALVGQTWHVHHCVSDREELHGQSHSCPCGHQWTNEEQLTLAPFLEYFVEAG